MSRQDALAGTVADIGVEQRSGRAGHGVDLGEPTERMNHRPQGREMVIREAAFDLRGPARCMNSAVGEQQGNGDVVRCPFRTHVIEEREAPTLGIIETIADFVTTAVEKRKRAVLKLRRVMNVKGSVGNNDLGAPPPHEAAAEHVGM